VLAENALDEHPQLRADVLADGPVDSHVLPKRLDQLVLGEPELLASRACCAHVLGELDQLLDHLGGFDGAVLVFAYGLFE
jgi:hypothetical protein